MMSKMAYIMNKESRKDNYIRMDNASVRVQSPGNVINSIQKTLVYKKFEKSKKIEAIKLYQGKTSTKSVKLVK